MPLGNRSRRLGRLFVASLVLSAIGGDPARGESPVGIDAWLDGEVRASTGIDYSRGDYGDEEDTEIIYVPFTLTYVLEDFPGTEWDGDLLEGQLTVPVLWIRGPGEIRAGVDGTPVAGGEGDVNRSTDKGLGDLLFRLTYGLFPPADSLLPVAEITTRVKFPTASGGRDLGTNETDVDLQLDLSRAIDRFIVFGGVGYRFVGDPNQADKEGDHLRNIVFASGGVGAQLFEGASVGVAYDFRQASAQETKDAHELVPYASWRWGRFRVDPYGVVGFGNGSPDYGVGIQFGVTLRRPGGFD